MLFQPRSGVKTYPRRKPIRANLANCERIGTPAWACVSDPLPLRGRPLCKGDITFSAEGGRGALTRVRTSVTPRSEVLKLARMGSLRGKEPSTHISLRTGSALSREESI